MFLIIRSDILLNPGQYPNTLAGSSCFPNLERLLRHSSPSLKINKSEIITKTHCIKQTLTEMEDQFVHFCFYKANCMHL